MWCVCVCACMCACVYMYMYMYVNTCEQFCFKPSIWTCIRLRFIQLRVSSQHASQKAKTGRWHTHTIGGYKQQHAAGLAAEPRGHSELARFLLCAFLVGTISLPFLVTIAGLAYNEPHQHHDILQLSKLGGMGSSPQHMKRDLFKRLLRFPIEAAATFIKVPMKISGVLHDNFDFTMVYPHKLFASLYHDYPQEFRKCPCTHNIHTWSHPDAHKRCSHPKHNQVIRSNAGVNVWIEEFINHIFFFRNDSKYIQTYFIVNRFPKIFATNIQFSNAFP